MGRSISFAIAITMALALVGQSAATAWSPRVRVGLGFEPGLATIGGGVAVAVYEVCLDAGGGFCTSEIRLRRSANSGATWSSPLVLDEGAGNEAAIAGRGSAVDVVWVGDDGLIYRRSNNSAISFGRKHVVSRDYATTEPAIARGPHGAVALTWGGWEGDFGDRVSVKVSTDGGATWGKKSFWPTADIETSSVAVGDGVVYVSYLNTDRVPVVRHSLDAGVTWSEAFRLSNSDSFSAAPISAIDGVAYVAYARGGPIRYRRTDDRGATWSGPMVMTPVSLEAGDPSLSWEGGALRGLFQTADGLYYTESGDGLTWSTPERLAKLWVGPSSFVAYADQPVVLFETDQGIFSRTRSH